MNHELHPQNQTIPGSQNIIPAAHDDPEFKYYYQELEKVGAKNIEFYTQDPEDFYRQFHEQSVDKAEIEKSVLMCTGGIYRSGFARVFVAERGYKLADKAIDVNEDPKMQGVAIAGFCTVDLKKANLTEDGELIINNNPVRNVFTLATIESISSFVRYLTEKIEAEGKEFAEKLNLRIIVVPGDESYHKDARNQFYK